MYNALSCTRALLEGDWNPHAGQAVGSHSRRPNWVRRKDFFRSSEVETCSEDCSSGRYPGGRCYFIFICFFFIQFSCLFVCFLFVAKSVKASGHKVGEHHIAVSRSRASVLNKGPHLARAERYGRRKGDIPRKR